ncbi:SH3 domain containing protein [Entamoeba histolytica HM-1:IMSS-B]|uniref:SH3 domain-containing protein n=6 Tax=Entamoeba histolytica TaxID=5759 RepID=C4LX60_ENTH1|nr:hypothetical protein EHI_159850 [Entamoeba histolytica HM-1:IMSS]EMD44687.1 variant SH3 domain containing protein, putative [Entamoeba histolytica KU27]EMH75707.1 SH3 domain containing protein [Entamoeba histolytica HM-1:IMSS-B]EMS14411.1 variant sh3 domain containing protein [Entamoeba histolytica HM-3:IMSS]ENY61694.1 variant sh3 domain containing protein [Entamoeba histolytica HM-1:IMSS-A]GAT93320.1 hypothetical protein CL6EHI_159850 [Entamoeba histolytica]|eukprot:XP_651619.1 hypothetical protein EHI_159850 [Entamoeba histolytica HM-1:IMSS]
MNIKRGIFQIKTSVGISKKSEDKEFQNINKEIIEKEKKMKEIIERVSKITTSAEKLIRIPKEVFLILHDCSGEKSKAKEESERMINVFSSMEEGGKHIKEIIYCQVIEPMKIFIEEWKVYYKRINIMKNRKIDMDRHFEKLEQIKKKGQKKQNGKKEAEAKYKASKETYILIRNEIINDISKLNERINEINEKIESSIILGFTEYINCLNLSWDKVPEMLRNMNTGDINTQPTYTPNDQSMINETKQHNNEIKEYKYENIENVIQESMKKEEEHEEVVVCQFAYSAENETELSLKEGDKIKILNKKGDWWQGECQGNIGFFPSNYVK